MLALRRLSGLAITLVVLCVVATSAHSSAVGAANAIDSPGAIYWISGGRSLWVAPWDGSSSPKRILQSVDNLRISPNGRQIAVGVDCLSKKIARLYRCSLGKSVIGTINTSGKANFRKLIEIGVKLRSTHEPLPQGAWQYSGYAWSPDGKSLYLAEYREGKPGKNFMETIQNKLLKITLAKPASSRVRVRVLAQWKKRWRSSLMTEPLPSDLAVSPNGKTIAYGQDIEIGGNGPEAGEVFAELWTISTNGSHRHKIVGKSVTALLPGEGDISSSGAGGAQDITWSPDGKWIVFDWSPVPKSSDSCNFYANARNNVGMIKSSGSSLTLFPNVEFNFGVAESQGVWSATGQLAGWGHTTNPCSPEPAYGWLDIATLTFTPWASQPQLPPGWDNKGFLYLLPQPTLG